MESTNLSTPERSMLDHISDKQFSRRKFMSIAGIFGAASVIGVSSCRKKDNPVDEGVNLGSGDTGILNYALALEQLEAAYYIRVLQNPYSGMSASEATLLADVRDHEIAHREFLKNALGSSAIPALEFDFSAVNFSSRDSVLTTARTFEDLGVSAYNGAGRLLVDANLLLIAGKIVSVEARHAAYIRDIIQMGTFADNTVVDSNGLDVSRTPTEVLTAAGPFIRTRVNANNLPS